MLLWLALSIRQRGVSLKTIDVYALGNALVDSEFIVEPEFLKESKIEKGVMTLIDESRVGEITDLLKDPPQKRVSGGSAANTIVALSQLGGSGFYAFKVNNDEDGKFYVSDLKKNGVEFSDLSIVESKDATGKCMVLVTPDADRTMNTFLGASAGFSKKECEFDEIKNSHYLYSEGYLMTSPDATLAVKEAMKVAREAKVKTAFTLSDPGVVAGFKAQFLDVLSEPVDLLFCNESEAMSLTDTKDVNAACEALKTFAHSFAITTGKDGSVIFDGSEKIEIPGNAVKAIDTNGAGDMYAGAFMFALSQDKSFEEAGKLANFLSSKIVTVYGPRVKKEKMRTFINEFKDKIKK